MYISKQKLTIKKIKMKNLNVTEQEMRKVYFKAFGKQFDDGNRKQYPLPIHIAYKVALQKLENQKSK